MSILIERPKLAKVLEPRVRYDEKKVFPILQGVEDISIIPIPATSGQATNNLAFTVNPNSIQNVIDKKMFMQWFVQIDFTGTANGGGSLAAGVPLLQFGANDAFRQFPISQSIQNATALINGKSTTIQMQDILPALWHYGIPKDLYASDLSTSPSMPDMYQNYNDWNLYGSAKNPLALYGEQGFLDPRGGFPMQIINNNSAGDGKAQIKAIITEPIMMPPFAYTSHSKSGFIGVNSMSFNFTTNNMGRMWSHNSAAPSNTLTSVTVSFYQTPQLLVTQISPNQLAAPVLNQAYLYPYSTILGYENAQGNMTIAAGGSLTGAQTTIPAGNIQLQSVPSRVYLFVRKSLSSSTYNDSDSFAAISNVNITFNNKVGLLSGATQANLYQMSVECGNTQSYQQFSTYQGSIVALDFGRHLGLDNLSAPGIVGSTRQFQVTVQVYNPNPTVNLVNPSLWIVIINEGIMTIVNGTADYSTQLITPEEILKVPLDLSVQYNEAGNRSGGFTGGSFWDTLKGFASDVFKGAKEAIPLVRDVLPLLSGLGLSGGKRRRKGGSLADDNETVGKITRKQLEERLQG